MFPIVFCSILSACADESSPSQQVTFGSYYCGRDVCDLSAPLAAGTMVQVFASTGVFGELDGATLETSDPSVVRIGSVRPGLTAAELFGEAAGDADVRVRSATGDLMGTLSMRVRTADKLTLELGLATLGTLEDTGESLPGIDRVVAVSPNTGVEIAAIAMAGDERLNGAFTPYEVEVRSMAPADEQPRPVGDAHLGEFIIFPSGFDDDVTVRRAALAATVRLRWSSSR